MSGGRGLPAGWASSTIGDLFQVVGGGTPATDRTEFWNGEVPWITSSDIEEGGQITPRKQISEAALLSSATNRVPAGAIVVATRVGLGKVGLATTDLCFSQDCQALLPNPQLVAPSFAGMQLRFAATVFRRMSRGTTISGITKRQLLGVVFLVPPLAEQHRIVGEIEKQFSRVEAAVSALERVRVNLRRYRAAVLRAAVEGRLVPTEAEVARREGRGYEAASALLKRIREERSRRWEELELARLKARGRTPGDNRWKGRYKEPADADLSGMPELPPGWRWATWDQIGFSQNGRAFPSGQYQAHGIRLLRPGNLHVTGRVEWTDENTRYMSPSWAETYPSHVVRPGELVMNLTAQSLKDEFLGRICQTGGSDVCLLNQRIARLVPIIVERRFIFWLFKSPVFRRFVNSLNTGSLIEHMFTSQLAEFVLPIPPLPEQRRIVAEVERLLSLTEAVEEAAEQGRARSQRIRQSILKWGFEGRLTSQDPNDEPASALVDRVRAERGNWPMKVSVDGVRGRPRRTA